MKIFITMTFKSGGGNKKEIEKLCNIIKKTGFDDFCFIRDIENYQKIFDNPRELMEKAREEILKTDILLLDMSNKPTGRAIEAGIAFSQNKKIIVIMKTGTIIKDTVIGIADSIIEYDKLSDVVKPMSSLFRKWNK